MSEGVLKVFGIALICLSLSLALKKYNADIGALIKAASAVLLSSICLFILSPAISFILELSEGEIMSAAFPGVTVLLRAMAVAFLTHVCASVCRDCGEGTLASYVEMAGKAEILVLSIPLITDILETVKKLLDT
jgi:stage III sporulation protein AD